MKKIFSLLLVLSLLFTTPVCFAEGSDDSVIPAYENEISELKVIGILSDDFQLSRDYIFAVEGKNVEINVNEEFKLECLVEGYDGKFKENCKFVLLTEGTYITLENGYKFESVGQYVVIPYYEVTLSRENCRDVYYNVYGKPLTITVK